MKKLLGLILLVMWSTPLWADVPKLLNYQGRLTNATNQAVADDDYTVQFRLYISEVEVNSVWDEEQTISTQNGYFHTLLGQVNALTSSLFNQPLWLGVQIQGELEMTPRQQLASSPAALTVADGAISNSKVADGAITSSKLAANAIVPSGAIVQWPTETVPDGWMACEGQILNTNEYQQLFAAIGYRYGGSGATFNLPDFRGYIVRGWDHGGGIDPDSAARTDRGDGSGGDMVGTKQADENKSHNHGVTAALVGGGISGHVGWGDLTSLGGTFTYISGNSGGNETRPKNIYMMYIIKK